MPRASACGPHLLSAQGDFAAPDNDRMEIRFAYLTADERAGERDADPAAVGHSGRRDLWASDLIVQASRNRVGARASLSE